MKISNYKSLYEGGKLKQHLTEMETVPGFTAPGAKTKGSARAEKVAVSGAKTDKSSQKKRISATKYPSKVPTKGPKSAMKGKSPFKGKGMNHEGETPSLNEKVARISEEEMAIKRLSEEHDEMFGQDDVMDQEMDPEDLGVGVDEGNGPEQDEEEEEEMPEEGEESGDEMEDPAEAIKEILGDEDKTAKEKLAAIEELLGGDEDEESDEEGEEESEDEEGSEDEESEDEESEDEESEDEESEEEEGSEDEE